MLNKHFAQNQHKLNLKRVIRNRLGGDLHRQICILYTMRRKLKDKDNQLMKALLNKEQLLILSYFLGSRNVYKKMKRIYYKNVYFSLCDRYTSKQNNSLFNFNGVLLPKPTETVDKIAFANEAVDFLIYYLINDKDFCDTFTYEGPYEYGNVCLNPNDILIDCGASMGVFSAMASQKQCVCYAFEPNKLVIDTYLSITALLNPNIHVCKYALSDKREEVHFFNSISTAGGFVGRKENHGKFEKDMNKHYETVQSIPLDTFVHENKLSRVDFIKADIEGSERYMLMGAKQVLKDFAPKIAICTYHLPDDSKVLRELILDANPNYVIEEKFKKMYAYVK